MINEIDFDNNRFEGVMAAGWIRDLESSDSRIHKEKTIEKALMAAKLGSTDAQIFLFNCYQAYNPFYTFNVRQVPETSDLTGRDNPWPVFWALLENLRTRSITGHRARDRIQEVAEQFDSDEWNNLARRVLIKDLRCGVSEKTINKVVGNTEWRIPVFSVQLAQDSAGQPKKMKGIKRLEVKLDGVRVVAVVQGDVCTLYSRNGKVFENFPQIAEAIEANRRAFQYGRGTGGQFVLDGEIVGESFQKLMKQAHRKSDAETSGMVYHIFDVLPLDALKEGHWNVQQHRRLEWLDSAKSVLEETDNLRIMPGMNVDLDGAEGHDIMRRFAEASVEQGYEGIMIKDLDAPYICKRSDSWMKWKPTKSYDLTIVGVEEGTGKNAGRLGALICEGTDHGCYIRVNVGSGLTDDQRNEFWQAKDEVIGQTAEIMCDAITQNQDGGYSLRFPRFLRFRDDK
jgi:DNA ligase-1